MQPQLFDPPTGGGLPLIIPRPWWNETLNQWGCPICQDPRFSLGWGYSTRYRIGECASCGYKWKFRHPFGIIQAKGKPEEV